MEILWYLWYICTLINILACRNSLLSMFLKNAENLSPDISGYSLRAKATHVLISSIQTGWVVAERALHMFVPQTVSGRGRHLVHALMNKQPMFLSGASTEGGCTSNNPHHFALNPAASVLVQTEALRLKSGARIATVSHCTCVLGSKQHLSAVIIEWELFSVWIRQELEGFCAVAHEWRCSGRKSKC